MQKYKYSESDFFENKSLYMYANENWGEFLEIYEENRKSICSKIQRPTLKIKKKYKMLPKFSTCFDTKSIINIILCSDIFEHNEKLYLNFFIKKFESQRIIYDSYPKDEKTKEINIKEYIFLSYIYSRYIKLIDDSQVINCLLKLNDKIINKKYLWIDTELEAFVFYSLNSEMKFIKKISLVSL